MQISFCFFAKLIKKGAFPFTPSMFIVLISIVWLLVARRELSGPVARCPGWEFVRNAAFHSIDYFVYEYMN